MSSPRDPRPLGENGREKCTCLVLIAAEVSAGKHLSACPMTNPWKEEEPTQPGELPPIPEHLDVCVALSQHINRSDSRNLILTHVWKDIRRARTPLGSAIWDDLEAPVRAEGDDLHSLANAMAAARTRGVGTP